MNQGFVVAQQEKSKISYITGRLKKNEQNNRNLILQVYMACIFFHISSCMKTPFLLQLGLKKVTF